MAAEAGRRALAMAGWKPEDVELLVVTTVIPDQLMPPTSTLVQEALGIPRCAELEISANCTAPTKGIMVAANQLRLGDCTRALVCSSQYVSFLGLPPWSNPAQMTPQQGHLRWVLSDGAAALALERAEPDIGLRTWLESIGGGKRSGMSLPLGAGSPDLTSAFASGNQHVTQDALYVLKHAVPARDERSRADAQRVRDRRQLDRAFHSVGLLDADRDQVAAAILRSLRLAARGVADELHRDRLRWQRRRAARARSDESRRDAAARRPRLCARGRVEQMDVRWTRLQLESLTESPTVR